MKKNRFFFLALINLCCIVGFSKNAFAKPSKSNQDPGFTITRTNKLTTAKAKVFYKKNNRKQSEFALDIDSRKDEDKRFIIKVSKKSVIVLDNANHIIHQYNVTKSWLDKSGPQTVYDLIDNKKVECSLTDYIDIEHHRYFSFRYQNILETYSNE